MTTFVRWVLPLLLLILLAPFSAALDLRVSSAFFHDGHFYSNSLVHFIYNYGPIPADIVFGLAVIGLIFSFGKWKKWRTPSLLLVLTLALGAGFVAHVIFKDHWGRPRPKQIVEFGGKQEFRPFYSPNFFAQPEPSKSFPCGHCTMGFYFFAVALVGKRIGSRPLYIVGWAAAIALGTILSLTRIAQGGHFLSDTIFSAIIMWYTALCCDWMLFDERTISQAA